MADPDTTTIDLTVDPAALAAQPAGPDDLLVVTPWYPTEANPYMGGFVRGTVRALAGRFRRITVLHVENLPEGRDGTPRWSLGPEGPVLWIGVPMPSLTSRADMMRLQGEAMRTHALDLIRSAPLVHCHVGAPTGAGLTELLAPSTRLVLTEHASYLPRVLAQPDARDLYLRAIERAAVVTAVGRRTAELIRRAAPETAARVVVVANPVHLEAFSLRERPPASPTRWLYVGNLLDSKGVGRLLHAFAAWVRETEDDGARLTVVGAGAQGAEFIDLAAGLGIANRTDFVGSRPPEDMPQVYAEHDVLVHLSRGETFGLTCVEAAASGLPVLATSSGGPDETLAVPVALGLARLVPVADDDDVADVVAGMHRLWDGVATATGEDLRAVRAHLERCYGESTIAGLLRAALAPDPVGPIPGDTDPSGADPSGADPSTPVIPARWTDGAESGDDLGGPPGVRLLGVVVTPEHLRPVQQSMRQIALLGGSGLVLTTRPLRAVLPDSIEVVDLSPLETRAMLSRVERALALHLPAALLRALDRAARAGDLLGRLAPVEAPRLRPRVTALQQRHRTLARRSRSGPYAALWRLLGPWHVARRLDGDGVLDRLDLESFDGLVVPDDDAVPVAARVLRRRPELTVHNRWTAQRVVRAYADRVRRA